MESAAFKAIPTLVNVVRDTDWVIRKRAVAALGRIGPATPEVTPALITALSDADANVRRAASQAFGQIGPATPEVTPALITMLRGGNKRVREGVIAALRKIKRAAPKTMRDLADARNDTSRNVRRSIASVLYEVTDTRCIRQAWQIARRQRDGLRMRDWKRERFWSTDKEEYYRFDATISRFVVIEDSGKLKAQHGPLGGSPSSFVSALLETIHEFEDRPPDVWEHGRLLVFYAATRLLTAEVEEQRLRIPDPEPETDWDYLRRLGRFHDHLLHDRFRDLIDQIQQVFDLVIARYWPNAPWQLLACVDEDKIGQVDRLNEVLSTLHIHGGSGLSNLVPIWLSSFDSAGFEGALPLCKSPVPLNEYEQRVVSETARVLACIALNTKPGMFDPNMPSRAPRRRQ